VAASEAAPVVAVADAANPAEAMPPEQRKDDSPASPDTEMPVSASPIPATRVNRGEKRQAADDEVRDSLYMSGETGVPEKSNQFDILELISDDDSHPGDIQIDMDV